MEALFLEHEGYFGALGSFLLHQGIPHSRTVDKEVVAVKNKEELASLNRRSNSSNLHLSSEFSSSTEIGNDVNYLSSINNRRIRSLSI